MSDDRFDRDLTDVLREIAGEEAPMSLRNRLSDVTERAPMGRQLWFATPMRLSMVAAAAVAVLALAILFWPRQDVGPSPSDSPGPSPTTEHTPSLEPTAEPTAVPTLAPTTRPTPVITPTPIETPAANAWIGIDWSDAFVPFPHESGAGWPGISTVIEDIIDWNGEYVGVGAIDDGGACSEAAFFRSTDRLHWEITVRVSSGDDRTGTMCPQFVAAVPDGLIALAQERIWRSNDGITWHELDPSGLRGIWTSRGAEIVDLAAGEAGMVVIGRPMNTYDSVVAFSSDGLTWSDIDLPSQQEAIAWDVAAWREGFVIVGRDGESDEGGSPSQPYTHPGIGAPAAWLSADGEAWIQASVEGDAVKAGVLSQVLAGSGGLMAIGIDVGVEVQYEDNSTRGVWAWTSPDGLAWDKVGRLAELVPEAWMLESDGVHIAALAADGAVWVSTDGRAWHSPTATGEAMVPSFPFLQVRVQELTPRSPWDWKLWVTPTGVVYAGTSDDGWATKELQVGAALSR